MKPDEDQPDDPAAAVVSERRLAALFVLDERETEPWNVADLGAILQHLLEGPLTSFVGDGAPPGTRMFDVLATAEPDVASLRQIKAMVKEGRGGAAALPEEIRSCVHVLAAAAARVRARAPISQLDLPSLRRGLAWVQAQGWVMPAARELAFALLRESTPDDRA